jgi:DNA-binding GntR family transcriptional regulator
MIATTSSFLQKQNLSERIFEVLKNLILAGELKPGERILEAKLATELNVSRAPIREALLLLAQHGFVTIRPQRMIFARFSKFGNFSRLVQRSSFI